MSRWSAASSQHRAQHRWWNSQHTFCRRIAYSQNTCYSIFESESHKRTSSGTFHVQIKGAMFRRNGAENSCFHGSLMFFYLHCKLAVFKWSVSEDSVCVVLVCLRTWARRRGRGAQMWSREITRSLCVTIWSQHASAASLSVQDNLVHSHTCLTKHTWSWTFKHFLCSKSAWIQKVWASNPLRPSHSVITSGLRAERTETATDITWSLSSRQHGAGLEISLWKWREFPNELYELAANSAK